MKHITAQEKVLSLKRLAHQTRSHKESSHSIIMCHGCFDILHFGHLRHFESAKRNADVLIVTITPDCYVNKGPHRPVFPEQFRAELVAGLAVVDWVAVNRWDSAVETIKLIKPDFFAKGQEYEPKDQLVNKNFHEELQVLESVGGKIVFTYEETSSSTAAFQCLRNVTN